MRLLIMGPQGVGKGTQAKLLAEHYGIPTISTGDIFRANIKNKTELGKKVLEYTSQGFLSPTSSPTRSSAIVLRRMMRRMAGSSMATHAMSPR